MTLAENIATDSESMTYIALDDPFFVGVYMKKPERLVNVAQIATRPETQIIMVPKYNALLPDVEKFLSKNFRGMGIEYPPSSVVESLLVDGRWMHETINMRRPYRADVDSCKV